VSDSGHGPGVNHPTDVATFEAQGLAFFDAWLKGSEGTKPQPGSVTAYTMVCPASRPAGGGPYRAPTFNSLARGSLRLSGGKRKLKITSKGASAALATKVTGAAAPGALCTQQKPDKTSKANVATVSPGVTLIGRPVITGKVAVKGRYGQIAARVWDLDSKAHTQRLITRGVYRLKDDEKGSFTFTLDGNGWKFVRGHRIVVELLGRDAPTYGASPAKFSATLTGVKVKLPVRDKPSRKNGIVKP
jgi:hypothetical protein